jgi:hypothetical protein
MIAAFLAARAFWNAGSTVCAETVWPARTAAAAISTVRIGGLL